MSVYRMLRAALILCCLAVGTAWANTNFLSFGAAPEFLDPAEVFILDEVQRHGDNYVVSSHVADGYYVYGHSLKLIDDQENEVDLTLPQGTSIHDEFFGDSEIYTGNSAWLRFSASASGPVTLHWQGCAEDGICYPPQTMQINTAGAIVVNNDPQSGLTADASTGSSKTEVGSTSAGMTSGSNLAEDQVAAQRLESLGPVAGTLLFFGFGLLLAFTPCVLPMIPIVSTIVVGTQVKPKRALILTSSYVLVMAGTYAVVGVIAGLAGANLQATLQSPWLLGSFAALFLILASSLFGLFELSLPAGLMNRVQSAGQGRTGGSIASAGVLGFISALLVGPCMTAPLAGALLYIGQTGSAFQGGLALFALGLGMGVPLLVIAVFGARVLPKPGAWMDRVRIAFGYVMVGMAVMMLDRFLPGTVSLVLWGAWILSIAIALVAWAQAVVDRRRLTWALRSGAVFTGLWSVLMLVGAASGGDSALQPLAHLRAAAPAQAAVAEFNYVEAKSVADVDARLADASAGGQWTLIDFYADWCVSCHVIERNVFGNPAVGERLARMQVVRPDVTRNDATDRELQQHWGVMGPPTLILVSPDGTERRDLRVIGEINASDFLDRLNMAGVS